MEEILKQIPYQFLSIMEVYYLSNNCFLEENYILNNLEKINHIPIKIVHGKEDAICPLKFAIELDSKLKNSESFALERGRSDSESGIEKIQNCIIQFWIYEGIY